MAAKYVDGGVIGGAAGVNLRSIEAGAQDWNVSCGVCHPGGGSMEYDRDMNPYSTTSPSGDKYVYEISHVQGGVLVPGRLVDVYDPANSPAFLGAMSSTNKAEIDCLMCHMKNSKPMMKYYISAGCSNSNPMGPNSDRNCNGVIDSAAGFESSVFGPVVDNFTPGTAYDLMNRNAAIKVKNFQNAPSAGLGATVNTSTGAITAGTAPTSVANNLILGTPSSNACAVCHARREDTIGVTSYGTSMGMKAGYGNYWQLTEIGEGYDIDNPSTHKNTSQWFEFGCKTGMGKRGHRTGVGPNDKWGLSLMNLMFGFGKSINAPVTNETVTAHNPMLAGTCNTTSHVCASGMYAGDPCTTNADCVPTTSTKERIPDSDVHDVALQGMQCATCHFALGSKKSKPTSTLVGSGESQYETFPAGTLHGVAYPAQDVWAIDHLFAQPNSHKDTYGMNNLDNTVTCESCHTTRTHPNLSDNGGLLNAPTPMHPGYDAIHLNKIACTTCHIPEVYSAPARLKYRDWTAGYYKNLAFKNILDWDYDMVTGSHTPMPVLRGWAEVIDPATGLPEDKIKPLLPALLPIWNGTIGSQGSPVKSRDVGDAVRAYEDTHGGAGAGYDENGINVNHGNVYPLFDGFQLGDAWMIDTKPKVDAIATELSSLGITNPYIKINVAPFDVTHGVVPKAWALGGTKRGGCVSCHSSIDMFTRDAEGLFTGMNPNYSPYSIGFFEGYQQPLQNAISMGLPAGMVGIGKYDLAKNWTGIFADFDCTAMCIPSGVGNDEPMRMPAGTPNATWNGAWDAFGNPVKTFATFDTTKQCEGPSMMNYFLSKGFFGVPGPPYTTLRMCTQFMNSAFDTVMNFPDGTAAFMGFHDGIAGLQGFVTDQGAPKDCDPFSNAVNISPKNNYFATNFASVNACLPSRMATLYMDNPATFPACMNPADPSYPCVVGQWTGMIQGTCVADANSLTGMSCSGGFRNGQMCMNLATRAQFVAWGMMPPIAGLTNDVDCEGGNMSGMFVNGRDTARARNDIHIQQSVVGGVWRQSMPFTGLGLVTNPGNPAHFLGWDQAKETTPKCGAFQNEPCCINPATGYPAACADGMYVRTDLHANQLLGYTQAQLTQLMDPSIAVTMPYASFTYSKNGLTVSFNASASVCPTGQTCSYTWDFGQTGGTTTGGTTATPTHTYTSGGSFNVSLTVAGTSTQSVKDASVTVTAPATAPTCSFTTTVSGAAVTVNETVSSDVTKQAIIWGDGSVAQTATGNTWIPMHTYTVAGTFNISLKVKNAAGLTCTAKNPVTVTTTKYNISGNVTITGGVPVSGATVTITGPSTNRTVYTDQNGNYTVYNLKAGTYTVTVSKIGYTFSTNNPRTVVITNSNQTADFAGTKP